jgi:hypothetical protein
MTVWFDRFDPREAQLPNRTATVGQIRKWINLPTAMGLPDVLENLVILTYARQASRMLTLQGVPVPESLTSLRDDIVLERQALPEQAAWEEVAMRASHIFGITLPPLPNLGNLQKLDIQVRELVGRYAAEITSYLGKLRTILASICGSSNEAARFKTAVSANSLCLALQQTRKPLDLFEAIRGAQTDTSAAGMGVVFKQATAIRRALDQVRLDVFDRLGQIQDEPRASVAQGLRRQIQEALEADEHVTALDGVVNRWLDDAMKLLLDRPVSVSPPPTPQAEPEPPVVTLPPPKPGQKVSEGRRRVTGIRGLKSVTEEIERELTEDAELEINWRIVKNDV